MLKADDDNDLIVEDNIKAGTVDNMMVGMTDAVNDHYQKKSFDNELPHQENPFIEYINNLDGSNGCSLKRHIMAPLIATTKVSESETRNKDIKHQLVDAAVDKYHLTTILDNIYKSINNEKSNNSTTNSKDNIDDIEFNVEEKAEATSDVVKGIIQLIKTFNFILVDETKDFQDTIKDSQRKNYQLQQDLDRLIKNQQHRGFSGRRKSMTNSEFATSSDNDDDSGPKHVEDHTFNEEDNNRNSELAMSSDNDDDSGPQHVEDDTFNEEDNNSVNGYEEVISYDCDDGDDDDDISGPQYVKDYDSSSSKEDNVKENEDEDDDSCPQHVEDDTFSAVDDNSFNVYDEIMSDVYEDDDMSGPQYVKDDDVFSYEEDNNVTETNDGPPEQNVNANSPMVEEEARIMHPSNRKPEGYGETGNDDSYKNKLVLGGGAGILSKLTKQSSTTSSTANDSTSLMVEIKKRIMFPRNKRTTRREKTIIDECDETNMGFGAKQSDVATTKTTTSVAAAAEAGGGKASETEEKMLSPYPKGSRPKKHYEETKDNTTTPNATATVACTATARDTTMGSAVSIRKQQGKSSYSSSKAKRKKRSKQSRIQKKLNEIDETPFVVTSQNIDTDTAQEVTRPSVSVIMNDEKKRIPYPRCRPMRYKSDGVEPIRVPQDCDVQEEKEEEHFIDDDISPVQVRRTRSLQSSVVQPGATAIPGPRYEDNNDNDNETVSDHQLAVTTENDMIPNNNTTAANEQDQGLVVAAEVAPDEEDIEAQVQKRVAQETENIETQVHQRILGEAVHADVFEDDTDEKLARMKCWIGCAICFVIVVIAVVLSTTLTRESTSLTPEPTESPSELPTTNPSTVPSSPPTSNLQDLIIATSPGSSIAFDDVNSPQFKALEWLENDHTDIHNRYTKERIIQRFALATLHYSTSGDDWLNNTGWLITNSDINGNDDSLDDECNWYGIVTENSEYGYSPPYDCDNDNIIGFSLSFNRIEGTLPLEVSLLSGLKDLDLSQNIISSTLPTEIGLMAGLETLNLQENSFSGTLVSELGLLTSLSNLQLSYNNFQGSLPSEFELLKVLSTVDLQYNDLTGSIPTIISSMTNLRSIDFSFNRLSDKMPSEIGTLTGIQSLILKRNLFNGTIPTHLSQLTSAVVLDLGNNLLEGIIPTELGLLTSLEDRLDLSFNILTGPIPEQLGNLTALENLLLNRNLLTGSIPSGVASLEKLETLNVRDNSLNGTISTEVGRLTSLITLNIESNTLSGILPSEIGNLARLEKLTLRENRFSGSLPTEIGNLHLLEHFDLEDNSFPGLTGSIPSQLGMLQNLEYIRFSSSRFTGQLPSQLGLLSNLEYIDLSFNELIGSIPSEFGNVASLVELRLGDNDLTGTIFSEVGKFSQIEHMDLNNNNLEGSIPSQFGLLNNLEYLYLSTNELDGSIPSEFGDVASLVELYLGYNDLTGLIPTEIGLFLQLERLYLAANDLTGAIPTELSKLDQLESLWLGLNDLTGTIPTELGRLTQLVGLWLEDNNLNGTVPNEICDLRNETNFKFTLDCREVICNCCDDTCDYTTPSPSISESPSISKFPTSSPTTTSRPSSAPSTMPTINCDRSESSIVRIELTTDDFPSETSWNIIDINSNITLLEGGPYDEDDDANTIFINEVCVLNDSCSEFTIYDSYGDGICCDEGDGEYNVYNNGELIATGGDFDDEESVVFGNCPSSTPTITSPPSSAPSAMPTINCDSSESSIVRIELTTDSFPDDTSWNIFDVNSNLILFDGGPYDGGVDSNKLFINEVCVLNDSCYKFTIYDSYNDGICCDAGNGEYNIYLDDELIATGGEFEFEESVVFGNNCPSSTSLYDEPTTLPDNEEPTTLPDDEEPTSIPILNDEPTTLPAAADDDDKPTSMPAVTNT